MLEAGTCSNAMRGPALAPEKNVGAVDWCSRSPKHLEVPPNCCCNLRGFADRAAHIF